MRLHELTYSPGARKKPKRVGRGIGSGHGKTSTRGHKGQNARSGGAKRAGFEGGQMPLSRRVPKRGFVNVSEKEYAIVNLRDLNRFDQGETVTSELLVKEGIVKKKASGIKILGEGELTKPLVIQASKFSQGAVEKIKKVGGQCIPL